jgi:hypothetical protein
MISRLHEAGLGSAHTANGLFGWRVWWLGLVELVQNTVLNEARSIRSNWTSLWSLAELM